MTVDGRPHGTLAVGAAPELMRVLRNLLGNAIRHTPQGGTVTVSIGSDQSEVWLRVDDSCGGIPDHDLAKVFDMGYRGSEARESDGQGAGMGLAIARGLLDAQSGSIDVRNHDSGCQFEIRLPAA
jgi:signal transduction histidine kinase